MASWLEKLGLQRTRPPKEELKDFCLELCPDNRIASFMITDHTPRSGNPFIRFVKEAARKAVIEEARGVPDNLLLFYAGIRKEELPPSNGLLEKEPRQAWRFIIENGGVAGGEAGPRNCPPIWRHTVWKRTAGTWRGWNPRQATKTSWHTRPHGSASFKERTPGSS